MLHHCPCEKLCSFRSTHPDPDLLTQVPGLTLKLPHCDGCAWWSRLLDEPDYYEQTGSIHPSQVQWDCPCLTILVLKLSSQFPFPRWADFPCCSLQGKEKPPRRGDSRAIGQKQQLKNPPFFFIKWFLWSTWSHGHTHLKKKNCHNLFFFWEGGDLG